MTSAIPVQRSHCELKNANVFMSFSAVQMYDLSYIHLPNSTKSAILNGKLFTRTSQTNISPKLVLRFRSLCYGGFLIRLPLNIVDLAEDVFNSPSYSLHQLPYFRGRSSVN